ncbi:MAG: hypothetical protein ACREMQ_10500 [Longimicrobiales bacterium]
MGKRKRKLTAAEKAAKKKRREEYQTVFINGKMRRVRRPPTIEGLSVEDFIRANADPIFLHEEEMWEYLELDNAEDPRMRRTPAMTSGGRELVAFITVVDGKDLIVAYAIALDDPGEIASLNLHRTPKYEFILPREERGVAVSHELYPNGDRELLRHIVVKGMQVDIETDVRTYLLDISKVSPKESARAREVLQRMHTHGGFQLDFG